MRKHPRNTFGFLAFVAFNAHANLAINGSFELPIVTSTAQFQTIHPGAEPTGLGWTVSGTVDQVIRGSAYGVSAFDGLQWIDLDGISPGSISQIISTAVGANYLLHFSYTNHPLPGYTASFPATALAEVWDAATSTPLISSYSISHWNSTVAALNWADSGGIGFRAIGTTTTLSFRSTDQAISQGGIFLDAIDVSPVPETGSVAMVAIGLAALVFKISRSRK